MQRCRQVATASWWIAAAAWLAQAFLPWTAHGPLSRSTLLDVASLVEDRILVSVPRWTAWLALLLPVVAAAVAVLALVPGRAAVVVRLILGLLGIGVAVALVGAVTDFETTRFGVGVWVGLVGVVAVLVAMSSEWKSGSQHEILS